MDIDYKDTYYYINYQNYINMMPLIANNLMEQLIKGYMKKRPLTKNIYGFTAIPNIGYPVPDDYIDNFKNVLNYELSKREQLLNFDIDLDIRYLNYKKENMILKKMNTYFIVAQLKKKEIDKIRVKTKQIIYKR